MKKVKPTELEYRLFNSLACALSLPIAGTQSVSMSFVRVRVSRVWQCLQACMSIVVVKGGGVYALIHSVSEKYPSSASLVIKKVSL